MAYFDLTAEQLEDIKRTEARKAREQADAFAEAGFARQQAYLDAVSAAASAKKPGAAVSQEQVQGDWDMMFGGLMGPEARKRAAEQEYSYLETMRKNAAKSCPKILPVQMLQKEREEQDRRFSGLMGTLQRSMAAYPEPEGAARDYALALDSGIPLYMIQSNPEVKKQAETIRTMRGRASAFEAMAQKSPITSEYLRTSGIMPLVSDQPETLAESEGLLRDGINGYQLGRRQQRLGQLRTAQLLDFSGEPDEKRDKEIADIKAEMEELAAKEPRGLLPQMFYGAGTQTAQRQDQIARGAAYAAAGVAAVGLAAATGGLSVPAGTLMTGLGSYAGASAAASGASSLGFMFGGSYEGFIQEAGLAYDELLEVTGENGEKLDPTVTRTLALMAGAINAGIEYAQLSMFLKMFPGGAALLGKQAVKKAAKQAAGSKTFMGLIKKGAAAGAKWLATVGAESLQEGAQQVPVIAARNIGKALSPGKFRYDTPAEMADEVITTVGSSAITFAIPMMYGPAAGHALNMANASYLKYARTARAQAMRDVQRILNEAAKSGKLAERSPEFAREFLTTLSDQLKNPFAKVYLPAATLRETVSGMEEQKRADALKALGVSETELSDALATGADLVVKSVDFAMFAQGNADAATGLFTHLKADAAGPEIGSVKEAKKEHAGYIRRAIGYITRVASPAVSNEEFVKMARSAGVGDVYIKAETLDRLFQTSPETAAAQAEAAANAESAESTAESTESAAGMQRAEASAQTAAAEGAVSEAAAEAEGKAADTAVKTGEKTQTAAENAAAAAGMTLDELLSRLGITRADYDKALENGDMLQIDIDRVLADDMPREVYAALKDHIAARPGEMTVGELAEMERAYSLGEQAEDAAGGEEGTARAVQNVEAAEKAKQMREQAERDVHDIEMAAKVRADVRKALIRLGIPDAVADASAQLFAARMLRSAKRLSKTEYIDPWDYYKIYANVRFAAGAVGPDGQLYQAVKISRSDVEAVQNIGAKSVNDFSSNDIKNTSVWARKFWQELGIKSPFFRAWFGDWRGNDIKTGVERVTISGGGPKRMPRGSFVNKDTGWSIDVSKKIIDETSTHSQSASKRIAISALEDIEDIISKAVLLDTSVATGAGNSKKVNTAFMHHFYVVVNDGKDDVVLKLFVDEIYDTQRNKEQRRAYELKKIEKMPPSVSRMAPVNSGSGPVAPGDIHNVADLFSYVKDNDAAFNPKEASKVVDANGEPAVFSHYTDEKFDAFDINKARVNSDVQAFFFAPAGNEDWIDMGKRRVDVYLNIRNPKEGKPIVDMRQNEAGKAAREKLISEGYDGVIERDEDGNIVEVLAFYPEQIKSVENIGTFDGTNPNIYLQAAWHGSPFDFDRFSLEHINSGEGNQAFGWGLYFAGKKEVSEGYRKRLSSKKSSVLFDGRKPKEFDAIEADELFLAGKITADEYALSGITGYLDMMSRKAGSKADFDDIKKKATASFEESVSYWRGKVEKAGTDEYKADAREQLRMFEIERDFWNKNKDRFTYQNGTGQLYQVDIPDEENGNYLLWDTKITKEQERRVVKALKEQGIPFFSDLTLDGKNLSANNHDVLSLEFGADVASMLNIIWRNVENGKSLDDAISHARAIYEDDIRIAKVHKGMEDEEILADQAKRSQKNIDWLEANKNRLSLSETSSALFWGEKIFNESLSRVFAEDDGFERDAYAVLKDIAYSLKTEGMPLEQAIEKALFEYQVQIDMIEAEGIDAYGDERNELNMEAAQARLNWLQENKDKISFRKISAAEASVAKWSNRNGQFFYQQLERLLGSDKAASLLLKDAGFVGIKYLDGFSRRKGEGTYNYVIFDDNAVNILETYYQAIRDGKSEAEAAEAAAGVIRGAISLPQRFGEGAPVQITITKNADASTAVHEMSHYFLWEMEQLAQLLPQDAELQADLETTKKWLGWQEGQTGWTREQQEQWARGFEAYLREGRAPSTALARAFARFKGWLCDIYRSIRELNVELSDDMRGVFDRLLASEEETEAAMMLDGPSGITAEGEASAAESDKSAAERIVAARGRELTERRAEDVKTDVLSKILRAAETAKKLRESKEAAEEMERITDEVRMMPVYRAIAAMRSGRLKLSDDRLIADHGPDVYEGLPEGVSGMDGKFSADEVAEEFGYGSGEELLAAIKAAPPVDEEVKARFEANHPEASLQEEARAAAEDAAYEDDALSELIAEREDIAEAAGTSDEDWAMIEAEHDAAKAAWDDPRSRPNCVRWIRKNGGLNYDSVKYVFGDEPAAELLRRCGPGLFGGKMTLDVAAESMTSEGAYFGQGNVNADQELYNVLMGDDPPLSPLEVARREGFAEARAYAKKRAEARRAAEAEREAGKAERKAAREAAAAEKREKTEAEKQARREAREELKRRAAAAAEAVLSAARDAIDRLDPNRLEEKVEAYKAAEAAAKKEYSEALHARDWERAGDAKDRQILNRALAVEARKAMKTVRNARERIMSQIRRSRKETSGMSQTWLDQIDLLFARFAIIPKSARMDNTQPLSSFAEGMAAAGYEPPVADWILNGLGPKGAGEFTVGQLRDFDDTLAWLIHGAREAGRLSREWETQDIGAVAKSVADNIRDKLSALIEKRETAAAERRNFDTTKAERAKRSIARCASRLSKIEMFCRVLDGGEPMGPAHMAIFEPIARAEAAESAMTRVYTQRFRELLDKSYSKKERRAMSKKRWYEMVGKNLTKEEVLCIALNTGNRENLERVMTGFGWNEQQLRYVIETTLDGRDWDFVQGVWDLLDTMWPQIAALQRDISGWVPERVHAAARTWRVMGDTSGAGRTVAGGYYPIAYNREAGRNRFIRRITEQEALEDLYGGFWSLAQTRQGHTKARSASTGYELLLNLNVIPAHFTNVIHDLTHRKAIIDVNKLLTYWEREEGAPWEGSRVVHPLEDAIIDAMGEETYDQFHPWLKFVARGEENPLHAIDLAARWLRRRTQIVVLGLKAAVSLSQINGFFPAMHEVGAWPLMKNIFYFYRNPLALMENARAVWEKSEAMRTRSTSRDRDVRSLVDSLHRRGKFDSLQESYFTFINLFDAGVVIPIWTTAYEKGLHSGMDEDRAIAYADSVVRGTQDIGTPKDLSAIQRGRETYKIFTMFYNAMNTQLNMVIEDYWLARAGKVSRGHLIGTALYVIAMPAIFGALITGRGPKDEDDDDKGFFAQLFDDPARVAAWCAAQAAKYPFAYIPLLRDFMSYALGDSYRYRVSPAFEPALQAGKAVMDLRRAAAGENVSARTLAKDVFTTGGYLFGYPAGQLNITFGAILDLMEGEDVRPADFFLAHKKRKK